MKNLDIAEVAQRSSMPAPTLRFYEEKGLIASIGRRGLRHVAACPAPSHMECPTFRRLLKAAAAGVIRGRRTNASQPFWNS